MQLGSKKTAFPTFSSGFPTCNEVSVKDIQVIRLNVPDPFGSHGMVHLDVPLEVLGSIGRINGYRINGLFHPN